jgi:hypothetical protein
MTERDDRRAGRGQRRHEPVLPELLKRDIALVTARAMSMGVGSQEALIYGLTEVLGPRARSQVRPGERMDTEGIVGLPRVSAGRRHRWDADDAYLVLTDRAIMWASNVGEVALIPLDTVRYAGIDQAGVVRIVAGLSESELAEQLFFFGARGEIAPLRGAVLTAVGQRVAIDDYRAGR